MSPEAPWVLSDIMGSPPSQGIRHDAMGIPVKPTTQPTSFSVLCSAITSFLNRKIYNPRQA